VATTIPAHLAILEHPDFAAATHSTNWVEQTLDLSGIAAPAKPETTEPTEDGRVPRDVDVEVDGRRFNVRLWVPDVAPAGTSAPGALRPHRPRVQAAATGGAVLGADQVRVPMQGTILKVLVAVGDAVAMGQAVCVLEAMKMENQITAEKAGTIAEVKVSVGDTVGAGDVVAVIG
jgi:acetyl-CoA/propionyl-CoA/long-chain acyl-CoA carboxylase, biotin carboxylase, biotin carboxyl carrier protein